MKHLLHFTTGRHMFFVEVGAENLLSRTWSFCSAMFISLLVTSVSFSTKAKSEMISCSSDRA